jgi:hypothetical protein
MNAADNKRAAFIRNTHGPDWEKTKCAAKNVTIRVSCKTAALQKPHSHRFLKPY